MPRTPTKPLTVEQALRKRCQRMFADQRRRARKDGASLPYGFDDLLALVRAAKVCHYCGAPLALDLQLDHLIPLARGGKHSLDNLRACCKQCNARKGRLTATEWHELRNLLATWYPAGAQDVLLRLAAGGFRYAGKRRPKGA